MQNGACASGYQITNSIPALAGCGRHCVTMISKQRGRFFLRDRILVGDLDLKIGPFSQALSDYFVAVFPLWFPWRRASRGVSATPSPEVRDASRSL